MPPPSTHQKTKVPPFPAGLQWINTAGPVELGDLRGKFVLLDFWTYCCINCMHVLPELQKLEKAHADTLVVIGVHSAKFDEERDAKNVREAVLRYHIEHPVVNDADHVLWDRFQVNAWPTLILIDPEGYEVGRVSGETTFQRLDTVLKALVTDARRKGLLDTSPVRFDLEMHRTQSTPLRFPGKVLADPSGQRLFIADSNHNRIVVARFDGTLLETIGSGAVGHADGDFASASFNQPQGMALRASTLYVADTENHLIRKVDLDAHRVGTIAGLGFQGRGEPPIGRTAHALKASLNSPWDLWIDGDDLYIAIAGWHQIWKMRLATSEIAPYAGNGREDIVDGPRLPGRAYELGSSSFAQPSGLASDGTWIYVADSEGSSLRAVPLDPKGNVRTLVGTAQLPAARLFTFGDVDGPPAVARLQHPLAVAFSDGVLYVADSYNNKIKRVDPKTGVTQTIAGTGKPGSRDAPPEFDEPAGLAVAGRRLFVADTNNHLIRVVDLDHRAVSTLTIPGLQPPKPPAETPAARLRNAARQRVPTANVRPQQGRIRLRVEIKLPAGFKINPLAPMAYRVDPAEAKGSAAGPVRADALGKSVRIPTPATQFEIPLTVDGSHGDQPLDVAVDYYYCREGAEGVCRMGTVVWTVPLSLSPEAKSDSVSLEHQVR